LSAASTVTPSDALLLQALLPQNLLFEVIGICIFTCLSNARMSLRSSRNTPRKCHQLLLCSAPHKTIVAAWMPLLCFAFLICFERLQPTYIFFYNSHQVFFKTSVYFFIDFGIFRTVFHGWILELSRS
jgi:hypothetical protein